MNSGEYNVRDTLYKNEAFTMISFSDIRFAELLDDNVYAREIKCKFDGIILDALLLRSNSGINCHIRLSRGIYDRKIEVELLC